MGDGERGKLDIEVSFVIVGIQVEPEVFKCVWNDEIFVGEGGVDVFEGWIVFDAAFVEIKGLEVR